MKYFNMPAFFSYNWGGGEKTNKQKILNKGYFRD